MNPSTANGSLNKENIHRWLQTTSSLTTPNPEGGAVKVEQEPTRDPLHGERIVRDIMSWGTH